jgi:hypothetical protein
MGISEEHIASIFIVEENEQGNNKKADGMQRHAICFSLNVGFVSTSYTAFFGP